MADVIRGEQKSAVAICVFTPQYADARDAAKQQLQQQRSNAISN
jgi:hypothetical protein